MRRYHLEVKGKAYVVDVQELAEDCFQVVLGDTRFEVRLSGDAQLSQAQITPQLLPFAATSPPPAAIASSDGAPPSPLSLDPPASPARSAALPQVSSAAASGSALLRAPMPGLILELPAATGDRVQRGQIVAVLEAMKMNNAIKAPRDGIVAEIYVQPGQRVAYGEGLLRFEER